MEPLHGEDVERVDNIKFLGIHFPSDLTWSTQIALPVEEGPTQTFLSQEAQKDWTPPQLLTNFYKTT